MLRYFFDSSALVKRYIEEVGSPWVGRLLAQNDNLIFLSALTRLEITAALVRRAEGSPSIKHDLDARLGRFEKDLVTRFVNIDLDDGVIERAVHASRRLRLRAADAIQFATALAVAEQVPPNEPRLEFVTSDLELITAGMHSGLLTVDPSKIEPLENAL